MNFGTQGRSSLSEETRANSSGAERQNAGEQEKQTKAAREQMVRMVFSSEARDRLNTIRMVKPQVAESIENQMIQLAASGRLRRQVTDEELKELLSSVQRPKREFKINWK